MKRGKCTLLFLVFCLAGSIFINGNSFATTDNQFLLDSPESAELYALLDGLFPDIVPSQDTYIILPGCSEGQEVMLIPVFITKTDQSTLSGYLYFLPASKDFFVLEINESNTHSDSGNLKLWGTGESQIVFADDNISIEQNDSGFAALSTLDTLKCIGKTLGISANISSLKSALLTVPCASMQTFGTIQTALHCLSLAGVGLNLVSSGAGCSIGIATLISCGVANCSQVDPGGDPGLSNGHWSFCSSTYPCGAGQGDCDSSTQCKSGLTCVHDVGANYGFSTTTDVCEGTTPKPTPTPNPNPNPKNGSCYSKCGQSSGSCYCDSLCVKLGDCCPDKQQYCGN